MSNAKHTPGPWEIGAIEAKELGEYAAVQCAEHFGDIVARVCVSHRANHTLNECGKANARLIAAAPELLAALREVVAYAKEMGNDWMCLVDAQAAILKATGGEA